MRPRAGVELSASRGDVGLHGALGDSERCADLAIGEAVDEEPDHLDFACREWDLVAGRRTGIAPRLVAVIASSAEFFFLVSQEHAIVLSSHWRVDRAGRRHGAGKNFASCSPNRYGAKW